MPTFARPQIHKVRRETGGDSRSMLELQMSELHGDCEGSTEVRNATNLRPQPDELVRLLQRRLRFEHAQSPEMFEGCVRFICSQWPTISVQAIRHGTLHVARRGIAPL